MRSMTTPLSLPPDSVAALAAASSLIDLPRWQQLLDTWDKAALRLPAALPALRDFALDMMLKGGVFSFPVVQTRGWAELMRWLRARRETAEGWRGRARGVVAQMCAVCKLVLRVKCALGQREARRAAAAPGRHKRQQAQAGRAAAAGFAAVRLVPLPLPFALGLAVSSLSLSAARCGLRLLSCILLSSL